MLFTQENANFDTFTHEKVKTVVFSEEKIFFGIILTYEDLSAKLLNFIVDLPTSLV